MYRYNIEDVYAQPGLVIRECCPWAALRGGFATTAAVADDYTFSTIGAWSINGIDGDTPFAPVVGMKAALSGATIYARTPIAFRFLSNVWPVYDRLFRSGVKQTGSSVAVEEFIAITLLILEAQSLVLDIETHFYISNGVGIQAWDDLSNIYGTTTKAYAASTVRRYERALQRLEMLPAITGLLEEAVRIRSPFVPLGSAGNVVVTLENIDKIKAGMAIAGGNTVLTDCLARIELILDILTSEYADVVASMLRHMPYRVGNANYRKMLAPTVDPFKTDGIINSDFEVLNVAGDNDDPDYENYLLVDGPGVVSGFLESSYSLDVTTDTVRNKLSTVVPGGMPALSFISSTVYLKGDSLVDANFALFTPHMFARALILDHQATGVLGAHLQTSQALATNRAHLWKALNFQVLDIGAESDLYLGNAKEITPDLDALINAINYLVDKASDLSVISGIDVLATTSYAPVVHPAVDTMRRSQ
jgi:hypothetical protein